MNVSHALTASVLAACAFVARPAHADPVSRPFKASFTTHEALGFNPIACPAPPFLQGRTTGIGTASQLGKTLLTTTDCVNPGESVYLFTNGKLLLVAAAGDTLSADYAGTLTPGVGLAPGTLAGSFRITGGTGRFVGATGAGYLTGTENLLTGVGSFEASGTLSY